MNLIGIRVFRNFCQMMAHIDSEWEPVGSPRALPVEVPDDAEHIRSDALLATISQYDKEIPGSDLKDVLARRRDFHAALEDSYGVAAAS
jgi:hypothetical protein